MWVGCFGGVVGSDLFFLCVCVCGVGGVGWEWCVCCGGLVVLVCCSLVLSLLGLVVGDWVFGLVCFVWGSFSCVWVGV